MENGYTFKGGNFVKIAFSSLQERGQFLTGFQVTKQEFVSLIKNGRKNNNNKKKKKKNTKRILIIFMGNEGLHHTAHAHGLIGTFVTRLQVDWIIKWVYTVLI